MRARTSKRQWKWPQIAGWGLLAGLVVWVAGYSIVAGGTVVDVAPLSLDSIAIHAVVDVTVEPDDPADDKQFSANQLWTVVVNDVLWDRGAHSIASGERGAVRLDLPPVGGRLQVSVSRLSSIEIGGTYVIAIARAYSPDPEEQAKWPWQLRFALDESNGYAPIEGTPPELIADLEAIRLPSESATDAVVEYASEWAAVLEARSLGTPEPEAPRLDAIERGRVGEQQSEFVDWYLGLDDKSRQLPDSLDELPEDALAALGAETWKPWQVVVLYDDATTTEVGSVAIHFPGTGLIGPYQLTKGEPVLQIHGLGPVNTPAEVLAWPHGLPAEIVYLLDELSDEEKNSLVTARTLTLSAAGEPVLGAQPLRGGGIWLVDLRDGQNIAEALSADEYRALFAELAPPGGDPPRSELDDPASAP